jgi:hypothetical protein
MIEQRRSTDTWFGWLTRIWDWIDKRDIDKHVVSIFVLLKTYDVTHWAMTFANEHHDKSGVEIGATIVAVLGPYSLLQAAVIKWYFEART